ncbi:MAG TPA: heme peroxidase family protein [Rubrobacteraceae bacterium]|nr:heme peroxidase family protein [Rubrobacteraceae bacterium]
MSTSRRKDAEERDDEGRISRRNLLFGAATSLIAPILGRPAAASAAPAPWTVKRSSASVPGTPRWQHAVGDPRGADIAVAVKRTREARFGLMFKHLPPFLPPDELLIDLAWEMVDPRPPAPDVSEAADAFDNHDIPAGFTFLGQFIDHDMTRDTSPLSSWQLDPHGLTNFDTPFFDLGSVYGRGPRLDPQLYDQSTPGKLLLVEHDGVLDLPRAPDGTAFLGDPRNDENLIICQLQIAFIRLHNQFLAAGRSFAEAQRLTRWHFQWVIVHDFLPHVVGQDVVDSLLVQTGSGPIRTKNAFYNPVNPTRPMMPIEYSVAAYRFGHSMIRPEYEAHDGHTRPIFGVEGFDLRGSRPLPPDLKIDWTYFYDIPGLPVPMGRNFARLIDTKLSLPLTHLPPTVIADTRGAITSLAERNLLRGKRLGLPAGQDVARAMGMTPLSNAELGLTDPGWNEKAPLWFYVLKEAELGGGHRLGPIGGRIVAEVILGILALDKTSYFNARTPFSPDTADFKMGDLLHLAGAV